MKRKLTIALAGNPNSGKTTIFNNITGARQRVGNYPGVTVEKREGHKVFKDCELLIIDLPGTYSLTAHAEDELVARNYIVNEHPDVIINVVDAENLERNLYLTTQLLEMGKPIVIALNMADLAKKRGKKIDTVMLSKELGVSVIETVGNKGLGIEKLLNAAVELTDNKQIRTQIDYGSIFANCISQLADELTKIEQSWNVPPRWLAEKLLEDDEDVNKLLRSTVAQEHIIAMAFNMREELTKSLGVEPEVYLADKRYGFISRLCQRVVDDSRVFVESFSDKLDKVLTHRVFGLPIFFALMWCLFNLVFTLGDIPKEWLEEGFGSLGELVRDLLPAGELRDLIADGIIGGVGGVLSFLPNILILFLGIAFLEDSGYMARAAFVMDRVMRAVGLHGKSFIPLLMGFGCGVPAVMGTRSLENPRDRIVTILVTPFMSCSAKLPVYTILIAAFFSEEYAGTVLFSIYVFGILLAVIMAKLFRSTMFRGDTEPFVMELPSYRMPTLKSVMLQMWERSVLYLKKAGTIILAMSVLVWLLTNYPSEVDYSKNYEELGQTAEAVFTEKVELEVLKPLKISGLNDNKELNNIIEKLSTIQNDFEKDSEKVAEDSIEYVQLKQSKEAKERSLEKEAGDLYEPAQKFVELQNELDETKEKLEKERVAEKLEKSYAGMLGKTIEPVIRPLGFDWKIGIGLITAFTAKEVLVSTLGTIYNIGDADETSKALQQAIADDGVLNPLTAYALMIFVLIYAPCLAVIAVIKRETNSWKWSVFTMFYTTGVAWIVSFAIVRIGRGLGL